MIPIARSCIALPTHDDGGGNPPSPQPMSTFRNRPAYVLLGDPGEGKTTSLKAECDELGDKGHWITARDFLTLSPKPQWRSGTLFIDGLDEVRAGRVDARTPFDAIRHKLDQLERPSFRLSCRMADWLGSNDRQHLHEVSPDGDVAVLRLEPLTDKNILEILINHPDVSDPQAFFDRSKQCAIEYLLRNPQNLLMLITAFAKNGQFPSSLLETMQVACEQLVLEHNAEHNVLTTKASPSLMLEAAGHLCALQLLAGNVGYAVRAEAVAEDYPDLRIVSQTGDKLYREVLASKLFSSPAEGRTEPKHRQVAEHLGGRYLAKRIEGGLTSSRIIALMLGRDGTVVTPLRGLSAWVAAHSPTARLELIDRDPIGVGLYGDILSFSLDEKRMLLRALQQKPIMHRLHQDTPLNQDAAKLFGPVAAPGMEEAFREVLAKPDSDDAEQFTLFVLHLIAEGHPLPGLADSLMGLVRDETRDSSVNSAALDAFVHCCTPHQKERQLIDLLEEVRSGKVSDFRNELLGRLLAVLYPKVVSPRTVWDYLVDGNDDSFTGSYLHFWGYKLPRASSDEQVAELLDELVVHELALRRILGPHDLEDMPARLLARGLAIHGEQLEAARLYDWLGLNMKGQALLRVRDWLTEHPDRMKDVLAEGLRRAPESDDFTHHILDMEQRLHFAPKPPQWSDWCLEQAIRSDPTRPRTAKYLLDEALDGLHNGAGGDGLSEPIPIEKIAHSPDLKAHLEHRLANSGETKRESLLTDPAKGQQSQRDKWVEAIRSRRKELIENRATPHLLHQLAETYFGIPTLDGGARDGVARTREGLNGDDALARAVLRAFQGVIDREDLPEPDQLLNFYRKGERHFLNLPFLVSLAESERLGNDDVLTWPDKRVQTALLLRHFEPWCTQDAKWYRQLVELRPADVAKAIVRIGASELKRRKDARGLFWPLAQDPTYAEIAKQCCLPLLRSFPTRCRIDQLGALDDLLWAAIEHADQDAFRPLVQQKLERKSMNRPQRIHWLTAARIRFGAAFQPDLEDSIDDGDDERRIRHLVDFLSYAQAASASLEPFDIDSTEWLLSSVGRLCGPEDELSGDYFTTVRKASGVSHRLINHLAASPLEQASSALSRLSTVPELSRWREPLRQAFDDQRVIRRDADYRHPTVNQVNETLSQGKPANATDLAALVEHHLRCIAKEIRNSNTDDWRQYWNLDSYGRPVESNAPRIENACRDTLLSDLRQRLPKDVQAEPEGHEVNDCAADIVVSSNDFHVPVEAKRSQNPKLWSALQDQLIAKYAPYGPGIYLVFWFGPNETKPTPEGTKPKNPAELEDWLRDKLTPEERLRIHTVVVDVEQPRPASTDNQSRTATSQHRQISH